MADESWVVTGPQVIEVEDVRALRVQLVGGRVDVVAHDGPGTRLEVHSVDGRPLEVALASGELRVGYSFTLGGWEGFLVKFRNFRDSDRADISIAVPRTVAAKVGTVSAEGLLAGTEGSSSVSTVSGSLVVDGTTGTLSASTVSGEIVVREHQGDLTLNTVTGELAASGALTKVMANSVSGAISLDLTAGLTSIEATSVSGDVTVRLPAGQGVTVQADAVSGRLVVDGQDYSTGTPGRRTVDLASGDGASRLTAHTVSGDVTLLRAAVA